MTGTIRIPDSAVKYILFQRTIYLKSPPIVQHLCRILEKALPVSLYQNLVTIEGKVRNKKIKRLYELDIQHEYNSFRHRLPESCSCVLDIGCGVAGVDVLIQRHYGKKDIRFYLLDKTRTDRRIHYGFEKLGSFYNSLLVAREVLCLNGISADNIVLLEVNEAYEITIINEIDLIVSLLSWGYHYPVAVYLDSVYSLISNRGCVILDIRKNSDGLQRLKDRFHDVEVIQESTKYTRVVCQK